MGTEQWQLKPDELQHFWPMKLPHTIPAVWRPRVWGTSVLFLVTLSFLWGTEAITQHWAGPEARGLGVALLESWATCDPPGTGLKTALMA